ncbi:Acg family FMN-binding oxidoreductase [Streptomyces sp. NPDC018955]|uniref:Acg family FMN-binding oxidoreductase n=1 Tax=Streptomyces sp. NPDC018955 TaxID=3365055 RepID=UPI0037967C96
MQTEEMNATALETLLAAAVAAPSIHNTQPWRFGFDPGTRTVTVHADRSRALALADPDGRALHLSAGSAVLNLRVAAAHLGWKPVPRLLPDPRDPELLATVRLAAATDPPPAYRALYPAVARRHSSRMPFTGRPVPEPVVTGMAAAARAEGAHLYVPDILRTRHLLRVTAAAELRNATDEARTAESRSWVAPPGAGPYGIPLTVARPLDTAGRMPMRDFTGRVPVPGRPRMRFERHVQVALVWTVGDRPRDWLAAGQALERALLVATAHGVRTSLLHQAMEWPDLREEMRVPGTRWCRPQVLIRFGYGPGAKGTPRATARPSVPPVPPAVRTSVPGPPDPADED